LSAEKKLAEIILAFFRRQGPALAHQVELARAKLERAATSDDEADEVARILAELDFSGWSVLTGDIRPILEAVGADGSTVALHQIGLGTEVRSEVLNVVRDETLDYASERSAELVGMRLTEAGKLVENPDARWAITDATRDYLRGVVLDAVKEGWSNDKLADEIVQSEGFSEDRAMMIARTETQFAANNGAMASYEASGVVSGKQWLAHEDACDECEDNEADGVIALDDDFSSGDDAPPAHPNCRCQVLPVVDWDKRDAALAAEEETP
jgi:SPP1 gp7 family putative phage head morphogenesis protein